MIFMVFPAYAGVIPDKLNEFVRTAGLSRVCGGDPDSDVIPPKMKMSFPRMRG